MTRIKNNEIVGYEIDGQDYHKDCAEEAFSSWGRPLYNHALTEDEVITVETYSDMDTTLFCALCRKRIEP